MKIKTETKKETTLYLTPEERNAFRIVHKVLTAIRDDASQDDDLETVEEVERELRRIIADIIGEGYLQDYCLDVINYDSFEAMLQTLYAIVSSVKEEK